jgi:sec-independent protein translocase protein TatA
MGIGNVGMGEILLIFLVVLLVFGAKRIPEIARGLGKGIREFKDATREIQKELTVDERSTPRPARRVTPPASVPYGSEYSYNTPAESPAPPVKAAADQPAD